MTTPSKADRTALLKALKRDWLAKLQQNHPIDTVETLGPAANDFAESQLEEYDQALITTTLTQEREALLKHLPHEEGIPAGHNYYTGYAKGRNDYRKEVTKLIKGEK